MKKVVKFLKWTAGIVIALVIVVLLLAAFSAVMSVGQRGINKVTAQAYAEGQYDGINGTVNYKVLIADSDSDIDKAKKSAYAQGHDDAVVGDIRIKSVTDSTFVWTKSPWDDKKTIPADTIKITKRK